MSVRTHGSASCSMRFCHNTLFNYGRPIQINMNYCTAMNYLHTLQFLLHFHQQNPFSLCSQSFHHRLPTPSQQTIPHLIPRTCRVKTHLPFPPLPLRATHLSHHQPLHHHHPSSHVHEPASCRHMVDAISTTNAPHPLLLHPSPSRRTERLRNDSPSIGHRHPLAFTIAGTT